MVTATGWEAGSAKAAADAMNRFTTRPEAANDSFYPRDLAAHGGNRVALTIASHHPRIRRAHAMLRCGRGYGLAVRDRAAIYGYYALPVKLERYLEMAGRKRAG